MTSISWKYLYSFRPLWRSEGWGWRIFSSSVGVLLQSTCFKPGSCHSCASSVFGKVKELHAIHVLRLRV